LELSPSSDGELARALESYLSAVERGESVDPDRLAAEHPAIAGELRSCLEVLRLAGRVEHAGGAEAATDGSEPDTPTLGDFRILRQVGRGGMGVVYEAEQISLHRRVALKVLPFAAAMDSTQLRRFQTEALAAAQLHHTNIVPVYSVGCERGVHYYAMQFIEGQTLAEMIAQRRRMEEPQFARDRSPLASPLVGEGGPKGRMGGEQDHPHPEPFPSTGRESHGDTHAARTATPTPPSRKRAYFRMAAELGIQAAEALDHAHKVGIVHRDIKPANLLLDAHGRLWITDFGLARLQTETGLTMTGDVLGTLRYMSPEQALAKRMVIDHRTDIYSLGATLYELLTLHPAIDGRDRQEILRKIAQDEPVRPRRLDPSIPPELETILLKAMNKEPASRYATAHDLADDLRRFLEQKPIRARRPTPLERAAKWSRRHTTTIIAATVILAFATLGLAIGYARVAREQAKTVAALKRAEDRTKLARRAVDEMYTEVAEKWLGNQPGQTQLQREFLEKALRFYEEFSHERGEDMQVRRETAAAYIRVGDILSALGRDAEREAAYRRALDLMIKLVAADRVLPEDLSLFSDSLRAVAQACVGRGNMSEADDLLRRSLGVRERLVSEHPDRPSYRRALAGAYANLGNYLGSQGRGREAESLLRRAVSFIEESKSATSLVRADRESLAHFNFHLGTLCYEVPERRKEALDFYRRALSLYEGLAAEFPDQPGYRAGTADAWQAIAATLDGLADLPGAGAAARQALTGWESLVRDFPENVDYHYKLATAYARSHRDEQFLVELEKLVAKFPSRHQYRGDLGLALANRGLGLRDRGEPEKALPLLRRSRDLIRSALEDQPRSPAYLRYLSIACTVLAETYLHLGRHAEAAHIAEELPAIVPDGVDAANAAEILIRCMLLAQADDRLSRTEREKSAGAYAERSRALMQASSRLGANDPQAQAALASLLANGPDPRFRDPARALELIKMAYTKLPKDERYWSLLGVAQYRAGDVEGAIRSLRTRIKPNSGGDGSDWFYLAMALWKHADKEEARAWFNKAASWTDKNRPKDDELRRLRAEAADLLRLEAPAKSNAVTNAARKP
jgi:serine/threonine protein kinase